MHVFISSMASILYLCFLGGLTNWMEHFGMVFFFNILAVLLPCCISDIVSFPLCFSLWDHGS